MIRLATSNRLEALADALADDVAATGRSLFDPVELVVPNGLVEGFVKRKLAVRLGIAANVRARTLGGFLRDTVRRIAPAVRIADRDAVEGELLALFHDSRRSVTGGAELAPVAAYLEGGGGGGPEEAEGRDRRRVQLAGKLADLFDAYAFSRPELLAAWRRGTSVADVDPPTERWQRELWLALFGRGGPLAPPAARTLPDFFAETPAADLRGLSVFVFGISYVARLYRTIFASLARENAVRIYTLNPCREFWEDLEPARRGGRDARRFPRRGAREQLTLFRNPQTGSEPPAMGSVEQSSTSPDANSAGSDENPLLARWGRPGRDNLRLLNQLTDCDFASCFADPAAAGASLLATLQQEILDRRPTGGERPGADGSLVVLPAPDARRELEAIAAEIWTLVRRDEERERRGEPGAPLRFSDFAVILPPASAAATLPLARTVFHESSDLPATIVDLPGSGEASVGEAIELLLSLLTGSLARPQLLRLAMHPLVARRFPDVDPEDWLTLAEELQIVRGGDGADVAAAGSYLDRDRVSWDQGLTRLALGAFLSGRPSGEERPFVLRGGDAAVLAAEVASGEPAARALGALARALIDLSRAARGRPRAIGEWLALARRAVTETILPETPDEESAIGDVLAALERLDESLPPAFETSFLVAAELLRARLPRGAREGRRPSEGVTVASFVPMRALPFRVVFVAGLDEAAFPSSEAPDPLDLRSGDQREGDVSPRQRDEYMFLETLLAARERLYLSYVARDPITGEDRDPSAAIRAITDVVGPELAAAITRARPPLARHEDPAARAVIPAAAREHQAAALGASLRRAASAVEVPPPAALRRRFDPAVWSAIAPRLDWLEPTPPPAGAAPAAEARRRSLTLTDLRRFLECPMQGSVRVLLPLPGEDDAADGAEAALREHEPLEASGVEASALLREVLAAALADGADDAEGLAGAYDARAEGERLAGVLPAGFFGRAARARHLAQLSCWRDGLREALGGALPRALEPIWLGGAPDHRAPVTIHAALRLDLALPDGPTPVELGGRTELLATVDGQRVAVTLLASRRYDPSAHKDWLRAWLTQLALTAADGPEAPLRAVVVRPDDDGGPQVDTWDVPAIPRGDARRYLAALAEELLGRVHPYLLPCEGVFTWQRGQENGEAMTVAEAVLMLRDDNWTRLSSDYGPVPEPRTYPVPADGEGEAIVARRFGPFFERAPAVSKKKRKAPE